MSTEITTIPFGTSREVKVVEVDGKPQVILKHAFEAIGIGADQQIANVQAEEWSCTSVTLVQVGGQLRPMITSDVRTFLMALARIPAKRVNEAARPALIEFQREAADAIAAYFTTGVAVNPRASADQLSAGLSLIKEQLEIVQMAAPYLDESYVAVRFKRLVAQAMGDEAVIAPEDRPLDVQSYLRDKGVPKSLITKYASVFGKRLKAAYVLAYGYEPKLVEREINGTSQLVKGYFGRDLHLFDQAHAAMADRFETVAA